MDTLEFRYHRTSAGDPDHQELSEEYLNDEKLVINDIADPTAINLKPRKERMTPLLVEFTHTKPAVVDLARAIKAGMNIVKFRMAATTKAERIHWISQVDKALNLTMEKEGHSQMFLATCMALKTFVKKTGLLNADLDPGSEDVCVKTGAEIILTTDKSYINMCSPSKVFVDCPQLGTDIKVGQEITLGTSGDIKMHCSEILNPTSIKCKVYSGGRLDSLMTTHIRGLKHTTPSLSKIDINFLQFCTQYQFEMLSVFYAQNGQMIRNIKRCIQKAKDKPLVFGGICDAEGVKNLDEILKDAVVRDGAQYMVVRDSGTDVLALLVSSFSELRRKGLKQVWMQYGVGLKRRYIIVHRIVEALGEKAEDLPRYHAFTGCDFTSFFGGQEKRTAYAKWDASDTETFKQLSRPVTNVDPGLLRALGRYTFKLYNVHCEIQESDGIIIWRGYLELELDGVMQNRIVPIQNWIAAKCKQAGKPVFLSGVLANVIKTGNYSYSDSFDCSNAIMNGITGFILRECSNLDKTINALEILDDICRQTEPLAITARNFWRIMQEMRLPVNAAEGAAISCVALAYQYNAKVIIVPTNSGTSARILLKLQPICLVIPVCSKPRVAKKLYTCRNVYPILSLAKGSKQFSVSENARVMTAVKFAVARHWLVFGDKYVSLQRSADNIEFCDTVKAWTVDITAKQYIPMTKYYECTSGDKKIEEDSQSYISGHILINEDNSSVQRSNTSVKFQQKSTHMQIDSAKKFEEPSTQLPIYARINVEQLPA